MRGKFVFYGFLFFIIIVLFGFLYFLGTMNLFMRESVFFVKYRWFDFGENSQLLSIFYIIILTIFFILTIAIMSRIIISLKQDSPKNIIIKNEIPVINNSEKEILKDEVVRKKNNNNNENNNKKEIEEIKKIEEITQSIKIIERNITNDTNIEKEIMLEEKIKEYTSSLSLMIMEITSSSSIVDLFDKILSWSVQFSNSKRASLMIVDKNKYLYIYKTIGWGEDENNFAKEIKVNIGEEICGKVAENNNAIIVEDIDIYPDHQFKYRSKYKSRSFISMPFFGLNRVVAVINLTDNISGMYLNNEIEIVKSILKLGNKIFENLQTKKKE